MSLYLLIVSLHVITAVFGLGPLFALAISVTGAGADEFPASRAWALLRLVSWGLGGMLVTGVILVGLTKGAMAQTPWLRASLILFVVLGALLGDARRRLRRTMAAVPPVIPAGLGRILWTMCAVVAAIVFLMEAKPS